MWHEIGVALCLVMVIEGIMPFLAPSQWKSMLASVQELDERTMRIMGFASMMVGTTVLYIIN